MKMAVLTVLVGLLLVGAPLLAAAEKKLFITRKGLERTFRVFIPEATVLPDKAEDGTEVIRHFYAPRPGGFELVLYEIKGGGHAWPGRTRTERLLGKAAMNIDANEIIREFCSRHTLKKG
jgi:hypothetical protein